MTARSHVISMLFAGAIAIASLGLILYHGVYPLWRLSEWPAWAAILIVAGLYAWFLQLSSDWSSTRHKPFVVTVGLVLIALGMAFSARFVVDVVGFGINSWLVQGEKAMGAVIALTVLASGLLSVGGLILLTGLTAKRHGLVSFTTLFVLLVTIVLALLLEPRML